MRQNSLTIKHQRDTICISGSEVEIARFIKWAKTYRHGRFTADSIICKTPNDMKACRLKALYLKLNIV